MIARVWHGVVAREKADDYARYLAGFGVGDYEARPGNRATLPPVDDAPEASATCRALAVVFHRDKEPYGGP